MLASTTNPRGDARPFEPANALDASLRHCALNRAPVATPPNTVSRSEGDPSTVRRDAGARSEARQGALENAAEALGKAIARRLLTDLDGEPSLPEPTLAELQETP